MDKNFENFMVVNTTEFKKKRFRHVIGNAEHKVLTGTDANTWIQLLKKKFPEEHIECAMEDCPKCKGEPRTTDLDGAHICLADNESTEYVVLICNSVNRDKNHEARFCIRPGLSALQVPAPWRDFVLIAIAGFGLLILINRIDIWLDAGRNTQPPSRLGLKALQIKGGAGLDEHVAEALAQVGDEVEALARR